MVETKVKHKPHGPYERFVKRPLDIFCSLLAIVVFWWLFVIVAILVRVKLGSPVLFTQDRPGKDEKIFKLYKFRTMTDARDENGNLLPDDVRLTKFGKLLRSTSLDELPEVFNILKGDMSIVGPRPQLVRDMVFMSSRQRIRHCVRPGLTGYAQVNGRNNITWEQKFEYDLHYIETGITFLGDIKILCQTVGKVLGRSDTVREGTASDLDFGDWLLQEGNVSREEYERKQGEAKRLLHIPVKFGEETIDI